MNCVSLVMLLFVRQMKTIYLLKLDNQAVDKKNTEDSPCANVNYINLCILCYDCLDLPGRPKTSKVRRRWAKDGNNQKTAWRLPRFTDLCQDSIYFEWLVSSWSKSAHYHGNLISKSCRSRVTHLYNRKSKSSGDVRSRVTRIIWVQSRVTLQILGPSHVTQKPFATLI